MLAVISSGQISTVEELCALLDSLPTAVAAQILETSVTQILTELGVEASVIAEVVDCVSSVPRQILCVW